MKVWVVLVVSERNPLENSFSYVFSTRDKAIEFQRARLAAASCLWDGDARDDGGILRATYRSDVGGMTVSELYCCDVDGRHDA